MDSSNAQEDSGLVAFWCMMAVIAVLLVVCVVLPLVITDYAKQPYALPLMTSGLILPFVYFFIFGGMALARKKKEEANQ
jgi:hypothetical protein